MIVAFVVHRPIRIIHPVVWRSWVKLRLLVIHRLLTTGKADRHGKHEDALQQHVQTTVPLPDNLTARACPSVLCVCVAQRYSTPLQTQLLFGSGPTLVQTGNRRLARIGLTSVELRVEATNTN
eukprot:scpid47746/ scgid9591/ 